MKKKKLQIIEILQTPNNEKHFMDNFETWYFKHVLSFKIYYDARVTMPTRKYVTARV